jgi:hypothetical protein
MKKSEAEHKLCPFIRYTVNENQSFDAHFAIQQNSTCATTFCMAWTPDKDDSEYGDCALLKKGR